MDHIAAKLKEEPRESENITQDRTVRWKLQNSPPSQDGSNTNYRKEEINVGKLLNSIKIKNNIRKEEKKSLNTILNDQPRIYKIQHVL